MAEEKILRTVTRAGNRIQHRKTQGGRVLSGRSYAMPNGLATTKEFLRLKDEYRDRGFDIEWRSVTEFVATEN